MNKFKTKSLKPTQAIQFHSLALFFSVVLIGSVLFLTSCSSVLNNAKSSNASKSATLNQQTTDLGTMQSSTSFNGNSFTLSKGERINNYIGFLDQDQVNKIKNHNILGSNIHSNQSVYNVAFFLPSSQYRNQSHAREGAIKELLTIYGNILSESNLNLLDDRQFKGTGREVYKIQGVDCLETLNFECQLELFTIDAKITQTPPFVYQNGGSYYVKLRVRLLLPRNSIEGNQFYDQVTSRLPNWTFNLVDYETDQVVHIRKGYQKYFF